MRNLLKSFGKLLSTAMLFAFLLFSISTKTKAQCTAAITGTNNPQPGQYTFFSAMTPNMGNVWYSWDFGDGNYGYTPIDSIHHTYSYPGTFYVCVTATDSANGGCTNTSCQWITVTSTICDITPQFTSMDMGSGNIMFTDASVDNNGYTITGWSWSFGDGGTSTMQNPSHTYTANGTYGVMLTVYNAAGCTDTIYDYVVVNNACFINPFFQPTTTSAFVGNQIFFTDLSQPVIVSWLWDFNDGTTSTIANPSHIYTQPGVYTVCLTVTSNTGCIGTICQQITITNNCSLTLTGTPVNTSGCGMCDGSILAIATGGTLPYTYQWTNGGINQSINNLCSGTYNVIVTDAVGCSAWNTFTIQNIGGLVAAISVDTTNASSGIVILNGNATGGNAPYNYYWYIPGGNPSNSNSQITTVQYPYPSTNSVCLTVYDSGWNCYDSICYTFSIGGGSVNCSGLFSSVTASQTSANTWNVYAFPSGGTAPYNYQWTFPGGTSTCGYNQNLACAVYPSAGTYIACCLITDALGCTFNNCFTIVVQPSPCNANFYLYSNSDSVDIYNSSQAGINATYYWDFGDGTNSTNGTLQSYFSHHYAIAGNYTICLYISDPANNCYDTLCQSIYACALSATASYTLNGNIVSLQGTITGNYTSFGWYLSSGMNTTSLTVYDTLATSGMHYYTFWATDSATGCYDSSWFQVPTNFIANNFLSGIVFNDANGNGIQDAGEPGLPNIYVNVAGQWILTDPNGLYGIYVADGTWNVDVYVTSTWTQTFPVSPTSYTVTVAGGTVLSNLNFGLQSNQTTITGVVFNDANSNGIQDAGETGVSNTWVMVGWYWAITDVNGVYTVTVPVGVYNVELWSIPAGVTLTAPLSGNYTVNAAAIGQIYGGNDFGLNYPPGVQNMVISLSTCTTVTPCFPAWYNISYYNAGTVPVNATVTMNYDPQLYFDYSSPPYTTLDTVAHIITWNVGIVQPGGSGWIWVDFTTSCTVVAGDASFNAVFVNPIAGDAVPSNNIDTLHQIATSSWDPNDKQVSPTGVGAPGYIHADQRLDYTIHFQNTGNAPAMNVVLIDTLSSELNWTSINILSYSHPMVSELDTVTGIITFFYNNIMLPDSGADYIGSMGFVKYSISPKTTIADGAVINNFADIYFDANVPVRTSTTINTIDYKLGANELSDETKIYIYPNPATESAQIIVGGGASLEFEIKMTNVLGQQVKLIKGQFNQVLKINLNDIQNGIYFINIICNNENISVKKLIVQ